MTLFGILVNDQTRNVFFRNKICPRPPLPNTHSLAGFPTSVVIVKKNLRRFDLHAKANVIFKTSFMFHSYYRNDIDVKVHTIVKIVPCFLLFRKIILSDFNFLILSCIEK